METNETGSIKSILDRMQQLQGIDKPLAEDAINFIFMQLDEVAREGNINYSEYSVLMRRANAGICDLIYISHFTRDLTAKRVFYKASLNLIQLLFTHVLDGKDYELKKLKIEAATRPILVSSKGG